jgi:hypothetical protein
MWGDSNIRRALKELTSDGEWCRDDPLGTR